MFNLFIFLILFPACISVFIHLLFKIKYPSIFIIIKVQTTVTLFIFIYFIIINYLGIIWISG